jgi:hypothetical protein
VGRFFSGIRRLAGHLGALNGDGIKVLKARGFDHRLDRLLLGVFRRFIVAETEDAFDELICHLRVVGDLALSADYCVCTVTKKLGCFIQLALHRIEIGDPLI